MSVGVLITKSQPDDSPRALELGWGLAGAWDPIAWWPIWIHTADETSLSGIAFTLINGPALNGDIPRGAPARQEQEGGAMDRRLTAQELHRSPGERLTWDPKNAPPGAAASHDSGVKNGIHQHALTQLGPYAAQRGDFIYAYIWLDPAHPPTEVMVQVYRAGSWEHRAYWGSNIMECGTDNSCTRQCMGALPKVGTWSPAGDPGGQHGSAVSAVGRWMCCRHELSSPTAAACAERADVQIPKRLRASVLAPLTRTGTRIGAGAGCRSAAAGDGIGVAGRSRRRSAAAGSSPCTPTAAASPRCAPSGRRWCC